MLRVVKIYDLGFRLSVTVIAHQLEQLMSRLGCVQGHARQELQSADTAERKVSETWMVLEFCSKGSLQDALDRHACLSSLVIPCFCCCDSHSCRHILLFCRTCYQACYVFACTTICPPYSEEVQPDVCVCVRHQV